MVTRAGVGTLVVAGHVGAIVVGLLGAPAVGLSALAMIGLVGLLVVVGSSHQSSSSGADNGDGAGPDGAIGGVAPEE